MKQLGTGRRLFAIAAAVLVLAGLATAFSAGGPATVPPREMSIDAALANFGGTGDYYLKIPGTFGDSTSSFHANEIDVTTFTWGLVNNGSNAKGGGPWSVLTINKFADPSSPKLMKATAAATMLPSIVFEVEKHGASGFAFETLTLSNVRVRSFKQSSDKTNGVSETVGFSFTRMRFRFDRETPQAGQSGPVEACWDLPSKAAC